MSEDEFEIVSESQEYRGLVTNRGLTRELNIRDRKPAVGSLDMLGLSIDEIVGKKVLDVGVGGGQSLIHAMELGIDYHAVDILPEIDTSSTDSLLGRINVQSMQKKLASVMEKYPDRVKVADFCKENPPYDESSFDVVMSAGSLPGYARSGQEVIRSILNMVKVAKEKAIFSYGWNKIKNPQGIVTFDKGKSGFKFRMKEFLDILGECGVSYNLRSEASSSSESDRSMISIHLDVKNKNTNLLLAEENKISTLEDKLTASLD